MCLEKQEIQRRQFRLYGEEGLELGAQDLAIAFVLYGSEEGWVRAARQSRTEIVRAFMSAER